MSLFMNFILDILFIYSDNINTRKRAYARSEIHSLFWLTGLPKLLTPAEAGFFIFA